MAFDYDKLKSHENDSNHWVSYSDLFMVLSTVFLLLFVVANIRGGTSSLQMSLEHEQLKAKSDSLEQQIKVYNTLKEDYLENKASEEEQKTYEMLMGQLDLLQNNAADERDRLAFESKENENKRKALNKYQSIIKGIIDSNLLAKQQINVRDKVITEKKVELTQSQIYLAQTRENLENTQSEVFEKEKQIKMTQVEIAQINKDLEVKINELKSQKAKAKLSKKSLQNKISKLKLESLEEIKKIRETEAQVKNELSQAQKNLKKAEESMSEVSQKLMKEVESKEQLAQKSKESQGRLLATIDDLKHENTTVSKDLKKALEAAQAKQSFAKNISDKLKKAGIKADVDKKTGDVVLNFGDEYFDTGSSQLKNGMKEKLTKFMPVYAQTLLKDPKTAKKIKNIEIIGFASSTFNNQYVNPKSLRPEDQDAIRFNLNLSYSRAQSIFDYTFDTRKMTFKHQSDILPKIKVSGQGFLPEGTNVKDVPSGISSKEFCEKYDCKKSQRVIIRFDMEAS